MIRITRKTDSLVDWIDNCGGFMFALKIVCQVLVFSYNSYKLKATLVQDLVRFMPQKSRKVYQTAKDKLNQSKKDFKQNYLTENLDLKRKNLMKTLI